MADTDRNSFSPERGHLRAGIRRNLSRREVRPLGHLCAHVGTQTPLPVASLSLDSFNREKQEEGSPAAPTCRRPGQSSVLRRVWAPHSTTRGAGSPRTTPSALVPLVLERTDSEDQRSRHATVTTLHAMGRTFKSSDRMEHVHSGPKCATVSFPSVRKTPGPHRCGSHRRAAWGR